MAEPNRIATSFTLRETLRRAARRVRPAGLRRQTPEEHRTRTSRALNYAHKVEATAEKLGIDDLPAEKLAALHAQHAPWSLHKEFDAKLAILEQELPAPVFAQEIDTDSTVALPEAVSFGDVLIADEELAAHGIESASEIATRRATQAETWELGIALEDDIIARRGLTL